MEHQIKKTLAKAIGSAVAAGGLALLLSPAAVAGGSGGGNVISNPPFAHMPPATVEPNGMDSADTSYEAIHEGLLSDNTSATVSTQVQMPPPQMPTVMGRINTQQQYVLGFVSVRVIDQPEYGVLVIAGCDLSGGPYSGVEIPPGGWVPAGYFWTDGGSMQEEGSVGPVDIRTPSGDAGGACPSPIY